MKYILIKTFLMIFCAFLIIAAPFFYFPQNEILPVMSSNIAERKVILLDAGHGGEDGGAIGVEGILEKDINLSITLKTATFLNFFGYDTELTRKSDKMTCDEGLKNQRDRKVSDIKNRLEQIENSMCICAISIHQNFFGGDAHGAQIFYSGNNPESKILAQSIQSGIVSMLQKENKRVIKESTKDIYILYHAKKPAVLVECGFISNSGDAALLSNEEYQNKMAFAIALSSVKYLTEGEVIE